MGGLQVSRMSLNRDLQEAIKTPFVHEPMLLEPLRRDEEGEEIDAAFLLLLRRSLKGT